MRYWAKLFTFIITVAAAGVVWAQTPDPMLHSAVTPGMPAGARVQSFATGSVVGTVRDANNQPVSNARVEIRNLSNQQATAAAYTGPDGSFQADGLPYGAYEITITHGLAQERQQMAVDGSTAPVTFRLSERSEADTKAGNQSTVSVAEMSVPKKARQHLEKAAEALKKQKLDQAQKEVEAALAAYPKYARALTMRGLMKMDQNHLQEALSDFQAAINADENYAMAYIAVGSAYNALGQYENAARALQRGEELDPRSWQAHFEMSKAELGLQQYDTALREVNRASEIAPDAFPPMHLVRAHIYLSLKNYPEAMTELEDYLQKAPQDSNAADARKTLAQVRAFTAKK
jgi:tetratricopeptide (TPR) repeat protein